MLSLQLPCRHEPQKNVAEILYGARIHLETCIASSLDRLASSRAGTYFELAKYVPQLVDGAGWQTTVTLINAQDGPAAGILRFFDSTGMPLTLQVRMGASVRIVESIGLVARGKGIAVVETTGESSELKQGYATFTYEDTPGPGRSVLVNFRQRVPARPDYEAAAAAISGLSARYGMSFDNTSGFSTAIALVNTDSIVATT